MTAQNVYNLQRALAGIHPLRTQFNELTVKLLDIKCVQDSSTVSCSQEKFPGKDNNIIFQYSWSKSQIIAGLAIFDKRKKALYISCQGDSWVTVGTVIIPGKKPQSATSFSSGFITNQKDKFCTFSW